MNDSPFKLSRRGFIRIATSGIAASAIHISRGQEVNKSEKPVRWGFVGTGSIANSMGRALKDAPHTILTASSSRTLSKAEDFVKKHGASKAFDSWAEMFRWDEIDAVYVATPTFVKEEISIAAAKAGKHVLCEKPLPSGLALKNILAACHENNVAFMDGTHFTHHPRSIELEGKLKELVGERRTIHSVFQFNIMNNENIRLSPTHEPMGALGDAGWYNMRAMVDYIDPRAKVKKVSAVLRRDKETQAVIGGTGVVVFDEGSTSTFSCAFDAGAGKHIAEIGGEKGTVEVPGFVGHDKDNSASYVYTSKSKKINSEAVRVEATRSDAAIMFEDFAKQVYDPSLRKSWENKSVKTQALLDAVWKSALAHENG